MARGSFGRTVARAAASGGSKSYRARRPVAWYASMVLIVAVGVSLVIYSRDEVLYPAQVGPTVTDHWQAAFAVDLCGTLQPALPASSNLTTAGIRTFGGGLIDVNPSVATADPQAFAGANATLGKFTSTYSGLTLTATSLKLPGKGAKTYVDGGRCAGPLHGSATLEAKVWSSPTSVGKVVTGDLTKIPLENGQMITVAFVPKGAVVPEPPSRSALIQALGGSSSTTPTTGTTSTTKTKTPTTGTTSTVPTTGTTSKSKASKTTTTQKG